MTITKPPVIIIKKRRTIVPPDGQIVAPKVAAPTSMAINRSLVSTSSIAKPKPKVTLPKKKPVTIKPTPKVPDLKRARFPNSVKKRVTEQFMLQYPVWIEYKPLAIGIDKAIYAMLTAAGIQTSLTRVQKVIAVHVKHEAYLANLSAGGERYNLDGTVAGVIEQVHSERAKIEITRSSTKKLM